MVKINYFVSCGFLLLLTIGLFNCQNTETIIGDFQLLPSPQFIEITGNSELRPEDIKHYLNNDKVKIPVRGELLKYLEATASSSDAQIVFSIDKSLDVKSEGYTLDISKKRITILAKDDAGLFYAFASLEQIMEDAMDQGLNLPLCSIKDFPKLAYRAIHIDIKHHREKISYYYQLMDRLASFKVNAIIAEVEDKIKYERQPLLGSADALSIKEWKELCNYAKERNIEISPLVQGLGHASFILKHKEYQDLRDNPDSDWAFNPLNPKTYEVQFDLYQDAIDATPHGKYLHIGGDEVHTTGRGSGQSPLELQLIWLNKVCNFAKDHGRTPIFWDDMPLKQTGLYSPMFNRNLSQADVDSIWKKNEYRLNEFIGQFPKNCIYMRWNYQMPDTYGNLKTMDWFSSNGFKVMGATAGQTRWVLMPQNESNIHNIKSFALSSIERDLNGLLLTLWDDDSPHFELYIRGIMAFAEYTWAGGKRTIPALKTAYRQRAFGSVFSNEKFAFIDKLESPVSFWKNALLKEGINRNSLATMDNPLIDGIINLPNPNQQGQWSEQYKERLKKARHYLKTCDSISIQIAEMKKAAKRNHFNLEVYEQVNELVKFSFETLISLEDYDLRSPEIDEKKAKKHLKSLREKFSAKRSNLEDVYAKTRILHKPQGYLLDQDHHHHLANQSVSFDWQFVAEFMLLEKL